MIELSFEEKYEVIGKKESNEHETSFITAVKTTGIFCKPTCHARKPKIKNVIFYKSTQEALQNGFRPCKICKPIEKLRDTPQYIKDIINELHKNPFLKIKDYDLRLRNINPNQIRSWFKKHHNITFHYYQRMLRINAVFRMLEKGKMVTEVTFESRYDSLNSFQDSDNSSYKSIFGRMSNKGSDKSIINIARFTTPLGPMFAGATNNGICLLEFTDRRMLQTELKDLMKRLNAVLLVGKNHYLDQVQFELKEYFSGSRKEFTVPLDAPGTNFQKAVWKILQDIPYGETRSYKQQAVTLNNPKAIRAVASANGRNRIGIIIPCHRVIGSDGNLVGYGGGLHRKKWLLTHEKTYSSNL